MRARFMFETAASVYVCSFLGVSLSLLCRGRRRRRDGGGAFRLTELFGWCVLGENGKFGDQDDGCCR